MKKKKTSKYSAAFAKYFDVGVKKQSKTKQKKKRKKTKHACATGAARQPAVVFLSHRDLIECKHTGFIQSEKEGVLGVCGATTHLLFTAHSASLHIG